MAISDRSPGARIIGTGHYLPERVLTNFDLEKMVDTTDAWIVERTGIRERRIASEGEASSDMATHAARRALLNAQLEPADLDLILIATITPDMPLPSTAMFVQQKIGARADCPGMDLSAACAGFIYGLSVADSYVRAGAARNVLVVGVELLSRVLNWKDRATCVLFGDGAGAVVVGPAAADGRGILSTHLYADGSLASSLCIPAGGSRTPTTAESVQKNLHFVHMQGQDVFKFAVRNLAGASLEAIEQNGLSREDVDWVIPHQANLRIINAVAKRTGLARERFYINIDRVGNTSSASVPIALDELARGGRLREKSPILLCALGGGFAWGSALLRW